MKKNNILINKVKPLLPVSYAAHSYETDPLQQFMFVVQFLYYPLTTDGKLDTANPKTKTMGCQKVTGLEVDLNVVEYNEGCTFFTQKFPGRAKFNEVTIERGMIPHDMGNDVTAVTPLYFLSRIASDSTHRISKVYIQLLSREGEVRAQYCLHEAFVSKWTAPDADADSDDIAIEKMVLQYEYFTFEADPEGSGMSAKGWVPFTEEGEWVIDDDTKLTDAFKQATS